MLERLQVGLLLPHAGRAASAGAIREVAVSAEELGLESIWVGDHVVLPAKQESLYPYRAEGDKGDYLVTSDNAFLEAFQSLAFAAAHTRRIQLGISVGILPYRHALLWAKSIGTLSVLSEGRVLFGAGVGWLEEEFDALGLDFAGRGASSDRTLALLRELWAEPERPVSLDGGAPAHVVPAFHGAPPPIWIGGTGARALRRAAELGDCWHPMLRGCPPAAIAEGVGVLQESLPEGTRPEVALYVPLKLEDTVPERTPWEAGLLAGPPEHCAEILEHYREAGVSHIVVSTGGSAQTRLRTAEQLLTALRG
jgi:probable F420-dependent oxidoreductase